MGISDALIWLCIWFVFPVFVYAASVVGLYTAYVYGGWLLATLAYGLCAWIILWMVDWIGRASNVDLSEESLFQRYVKPLEFAWPGLKGDAARLQFARENLARVVRYLPSQEDLPIYMGRYAEIEIYPRAVIASDNYDEYIRLYFGPKWHTWAALISFLAWPISMPLAFVAMHVYAYYREWKEGR